ncbi:beta-propeller fold lactonase family protein [Hydrogenoanaerobacterium sp.]|uniref:lactonase family protein n=1 Tax=Hydrogenoanaerobacterium sp. TaxID=2953763 RepID=UPI0028A27D01|nr:beta-propeller fold lactonase family protein [Hydrogenoanaerobacterium sp.]
MARDILLAVGGYTQPGSPDLALINWNGRQGEICHALHTGTNPSFLIQKGKTLYAGHELVDCVKITSYRIKESALEQKGEITLLGAGLCHLSDADTCLVGSCWQSGDFFAVDYTLQKELWRMCLPGAKKDVAHAHCSVLMGQELLCCDMGSDCIACYDLSAEVPQLLWVKVFAPNTGPRQIIPVDNAKFVLICENSNSVMLCKKSKAGCFCLYTLSLAQLGSGWPGGACMVESETIAVSVRGVPKIAIIRVEADSLRLHRIQPLCGDWVRMITFLSDKTLLAVQQKMNIVEAVPPKIGAKFDTVALEFAAPAFVLQVTEKEDDNNEHK